MNKEMLEKLKMGVISFAAVGILAACTTDDGVEEQPVDEPAVEEPADDTDPADETVPANDMDGVEDGDDVDDTEQDPDE